MPTGLPDWTTGVDILAQTIENLAVDIEAQTIGNLAVNIAASAITLNVNLTASDITLNVDVTAQTIGNLTIDIEAQSVAVFNKSEWEAKENTQKYLNGRGTAITAGSSSLVIDYQLAAGKSFFVTVISGGTENSGTTNANLRGYLYDDNVAMVRLAGAHGFGLAFPTPVRIDGGGAGNNVHLSLLNLGPDTCDLVGAVGGYEIDTPA